MIKTLDTLQVHSIEIQDMIMMWLSSVVNEHVNDMLTVIWLVRRVIPHW